LRDARRGRRWIAATNGVNRAFDSWIKSGGFGGVKSMHMHDSDLVSP
jgi:hypothetical protein